ncbi:hypothetical protein FKW77_001321 [Venturia effusa]|uniref:Uncharacterized protein n=1 Tax=Venturia effusa TaxID=50376 RepID=A0A517LJM8_9PEZI|nr:hypothetical protein FKW77_001321 [Venturia effusa]
MTSLNTCTGPIDLIKRVKERVDACPGIKLALGGHSQGGAVVAVATPQIPQKYLSSIVAITMFGSPPCSDLTKSSIAGVKELGTRCKSFCNKGDTICDSSGPMGNGGPRAKCVIKQQIRGLSAPGDISINQGTMYPSFAAPPPLNESEVLELKRLNKQAAATCGEDERGHVSKGGGGMAAHMAYNIDGYYVAAASCYIAKQYKASSGAAAQKANT